MCGAHWAAVPAPLRREVNRTWRILKLNLFDRESRSRYQFAVDEAVKAVSA